MPDPIQIRMGGYGPASTGFSRALKSIGDRLTAEFGDRVDVKYVWNIMELGYRAEDILWLVEHGLLTLGYHSSSYLTDRVPELGIADLPFLFAGTQAARAAMGGALGDLLARKIEERVNYRVLGWFDNGLRRIANPRPGRGGFSGRPARAGGGTPAQGQRGAGLRERRTRRRRAGCLRGRGRAAAQRGARDLRASAVRYDGRARRVSAFVAMRAAPYPRRSSGSARMSAQNTLYLDFGA